MTGWWFQACFYLIFHVISSWDNQIIPRGCHHGIIPRGYVIPLKPLSRWCFMTQIGRPWCLWTSQCAWDTCLRLCPLYALRVRTGKFGEGMISAFQKWWFKGSHQERWKRGSPPILIWCTNFLIPSTISMFSTNDVLDVSVLPTHSGKLGFSMF